MLLTIDLGWRQETIDLGDPDEKDGLFDDGDIGAYAGNIYLHIDGKEYGSLYIHHDQDGPLIELGQYDPDADEWVQRAQLRPIRIREDEQ